MNHFDFTKKHIEKEKEYIKANIKDSIQLSLDNILNQMSINHQKKNFRKLLKLILLYVLKIDRMEESELKQGSMVKVISLFNDHGFFKELIYSARELHASYKGADLSSFEGECYNLLGVVSLWFTREDMSAYYSLYKNSLLEMIVNLVVTDYSDLIGSMNYLLKKKKDPTYRNIKQIVFRIQQIKMGSNVKAEEFDSLLKSAKLALLEYPSSSTVRLMYNDILLFVGCYNPPIIQSYNDDGKMMPEVFTKDFRLYDIYTSNTNNTSYNKRISPLKVAILQYPHSPFYQQLLAHLISVEKNHATQLSAPSQIKSPSKDHSEALSACKREKYRILSSSPLLRGSKAIKGRTGRMT